MLAMTFAMGSDMRNFSGPEELYAKIIETLCVETRSNIHSNFLRLNSILDLRLGGFKKRKKGILIAFLWPFSEPQHCYSESYCDKNGIACDCE